MDGPKVACTASGPAAGVNIALGNASVCACPAFDRDSDDTVSIAEIIAAVNSALTGCPS